MLVGPVALARYETARPPLQVSCSPRAVKRAEGSGRTVIGASTQVRLKPRAENQCIPPGTAGQGGTMRNSYGKIAGAALVVVFGCVLFANIARAHVNVTCP